MSSFLSFFSSVGFPLAKLVYVVKRKLKGIQQRDSTVAYRFIFLCLSYYFLRIKFSYIVVFLPPPVLIRHKRGLKCNLLFNLLHFLLDVAVSVVVAFLAFTKFDDIDQTFVSYQ